MSLLDRVAVEAANVELPVANKAVTRRKVLRRAAGGIVGGLFGVSIGSKALAQTPCPVPPACDTTRYCLRCPDFGYCYWQRRFLGSPCPDRCSSLTATFIRCN